MHTPPSPDSALTPHDALALFQNAPQRYIPVGDGGEVAYRRVGRGPDVLFVHGWPVSGATFRDLLPYLSPHVTCHLLDLVGAGQSRFIAGQTPIDLAHHIGAVRRVVDVLGLDDFSVVGHDSGGLIARHALGPDDRVRSMVLCDTEQSAGLHWRFRQFLWMGYVPGFATLLAHIVNRPTLRRLPMFLGGCFHDDTHLRGPFSELFLEPLNTDRRRRWAAGQLVKTFDVRRVDELAALHAQMQMPVKLVWGEHDPFFPVAWAREMVDTFPRASLEIVPEAKLYVHEERPREVARAILPTLLLERGASPPTNQEEHP